MTGCRRRARLAVTHFALAAVFGILGILLSACRDFERPPVVHSLAPGQGVSIWQVFVLCDAKEDPVPWGRILVDPKKVEQATDISGGRLNVVTEGGWAVCNAPVLRADEPPYAIYFDLGLDTPAELKEVELYVLVSDKAIGALDEQGEPPDSWPVSRWEWDAGGWMQPIQEVGPPPAVRLVTDRILAGRVTDAWYQVVTNEQCAHNQCLSMAIANALAYLEAMGVVMIAQDHEPGLRGDQTLVGVLDGYTDRTVTSRTEGQGLSITAAFGGTFDYLHDEGLASALTHRHQAHSRAGLAPGDFSGASSTSVDDGPDPTFAWIFERVGAGAGVVAGMLFDGGGGHAVRVTAAGRDDAGQQWIRYSHDALQTHRDSFDTSGLENVVVELEDTDGDGTLNFSPSAELVFVWAHR